MGFIFLKRECRGRKPPARGSHAVPPGQVWPSWEESFGLPYPEGATGSGHRPEEVEAFTVGDADLLRGYHEAVHARVVLLLRDLRLEDFGRIVDLRWTPHITAAVLLGSVLNDTTQHVGQAAYIRGLLRA